MTVRKTGGLLPSCAGAESSSAAFLTTCSLYAQVPSPAADVSPAAVVTVPSASLGAEQFATVLLPAGYARSNRRYPVLYLLHGGGQDHTAFATRSWFRALAEFVDGRYRTIVSRDGRALAGVSMGAWGAMLLGLKHPQIFGAVGAFSAPFGISRQDPKMDMASRTQQRFGVPDTPDRTEDSVRVS